MWSVLLFWIASSTLSAVNGLWMKSTTPKVKPALIRLRSSSTTNQDYLGVPVHGKQVICYCKAIFPGQHNIDDNKSNRRLPYISSASSPVRASAMTLCPPVSRISRSTHLVTRSSSMIMIFFDMAYINTALYISNTFRLIRYL